MPNQELTTPRCCEEVIQYRSVYLRYPEDAIYGSNKNGQKGFKPQWVTGINDQAGERVSGPAIARYCPHCGTPTPEIIKRSTKKKICVVTDGGYYCDTCKERLRECQCALPEYAWEPVPLKRPPTKQTGDPHRFYCDQGKYRGRCKFDDPECPMVIKVVHLK